MGTENYEENTEDDETLREEDPSQESDSSEKEDPTTSISNCSSRSSLENASSTTKVDETNDEKYNNNHNDDEDSRNECTNKENVACSEEESKTNEKDNKSTTRSSDETKQDEKYNKDTNSNRKRKLSDSDFDEEDQNASTSNRKRRKTDEYERKQKQEDTKEYRQRLEHLSKFGRNFYCPTATPRKGLRPIYIDGSNVAYCHGNDRKFSVRGLKICIDYFKKRGHKVVAFVPQFRLRKGETDDHRLIHKLEKEKSVITTPTLYIKSQRRSPYDDWYIVQSAAVNEGIIVSRDNFQDIIEWKESLRKTVEERRLVPTFVDDLLIFPVDPHGNRKNDFESFLRY